MKKRQATALGAGIGLTVAVLAHLVYWYQPRERSALPSDAARRTLADASWEIAAWLPYPHQNLGVVERRVGDLRRWLELVASERGRTARSLPGLGPWPLPPARELIVAVRGRDLAIELDTYPFVGWIARTSGRLAGNRWLAGGDVPLGEGRRAKVEWRDGRWLLRTAGVQSLAESEPIETPSAVLAWLRLGEPLGRLPAGLYRLERLAGQLELLAGRPAPARLPVLDQGAESPVAGWLVERRGRRGLRGLVLWQEEGAAPPFPAAMALERGRGARQRLPGEELLRVAGGEPARSRVAGLRLRALAKGELDRGAPIAAEIAERFAQRRRLGLWAGIRPRPLAAAAERVADEMRGLPLAHLMGIEPERLGRLLAPLGGCSVSVLEVWSDPAAARWRICLAEPDGVRPH